MANIAQAVDQDLLDVLALLKEVNLPVEGVADHLRYFFVAQEGHRIVGCAGIEIYKDVGLIRSVAIHPSFQGHGLGRKLVERIHSFAIQKDLKEIYLITDTAKQFFAKLSYVVIPRDHVDPKIKQSIEFTLVCATSGVCMVKTLK